MVGRIPGTEDTALIKLNKNTFLAYNAMVETETEWFNLG